MEKYLGQLAPKNCAKVGLIDGIEKKKKVFIENALFIIGKFVHHNWVTISYSTQPEHQINNRSDGHIEIQNKCKSL